MRFASPNDNFAETRLLQWTRGAHYISFVISMVSQDSCVLNKPQTYTYSKQQNTNTQKPERRQYGRQDTKNDPPQQRRQEALRSSGREWKIQGYSDVRTRAPSRS